MSVKSGPRPAGFLSIVERYEVLLAVALSCDEVEIEEFVDEVAGYGMGYVNPWPFHSDERVVDPPVFVILLSSKR